MVDGKAIGGLLGAGVTILAGYGLVKLTQEMMKEGKKAVKKEVTNPVKKFGGYSDERVKRMLR